MASFGRVRRFHSGGINTTSDEFPAILQRGEEVLARTDPRNRAKSGRLFAARGDAARAGQQPVVVHIHGDPSVMMGFIRLQVRLDGGVVQHVLGQ